MNLLMMMILLVFGLTWILISCPVYLGQVRRFLYRLLIRPAKNPRFDLLCTIIAQLLISVVLRWALRWPYFEVVLVDPPYLP